MEYFLKDGISNLRLLRPDPDKVAALQAAAEGRSFLFFAGANADFMEGFAQATVQLGELLKVPVDARVLKVIWVGPRNADG